MICDKNFQESLVCYKTLGPKPKLLCQGACLNSYLKEIWLSFGLETCKKLEEILKCIYLKEKITFLQDGHKLNSGYNFLYFII